MKEKEWSEKEGGGNNVAYILIAGVLKAAALSRNW